MSAGIAPRSWSAIGVPAAMLVEGRDAREVELADTAEVQLILSRAVKRGDSPV
jgi:hypothetical protein